MSSVTFDTLRFAKRLVSAGMASAQAEAFAEAQRDVFGEALETQLVTKSDISELKTELVALKGEVGSIKWMMGVLIASAIANFAKQFF